MFPAKCASVNTNQHGQKNKTRDGQVAYNERLSIFCRSSIKTVPVLGKRKALLLLFSQPPEKKKGEFVRNFCFFSEVRHLDLRVDQKGENDGEIRKEWVKTHLDSHHRFLSAAAAAFFAAKMGASRSCSALACSSAEAMTPAGQSAK